MPREFVAIEPDAFNPLDVAKARRDGPRHLVPVQVQARELCELPMHAGMLPVS